MTKKKLLGLFGFIFLVTASILCLGYYSTKKEQKKLDQMYVEEVQVDAMFYASNYKSDYTETGLLFNTQESEELSNAISDTIKNTITDGNVTQDTINTLNTNLEKVIADKIQSMGKNVTKEELEFLTSGLQAIAISNIYKILQENPESSYLMTEIANLYKNITYPSYNQNASENITLIELQKKIDQQNALYESKTYQLNNTVDSYSALIQQIMENESSNIKQILEMQKKLDSMQTIISALENTINNDDIKQVSLSELEKSEIKNELLELESIIQIIQSDYSSAGDDNNNLISEIDSIKTTIKEINMDIDDIGSLSGSDITALSSSLNSLKSVVLSNYKEHDSNISTLNSEVQSTKSDLLSTKTNLQSEMQSTKTELKSEMQSTKSDLQTEMQTTKSDLQTEMDTTKSNLQTTKSDLQAEISTNKSQLQSEIQTTKSDLQTEIGSNKTQLQSEIQTTKSDLQTEISTNKSQLQTEMNETNSELSQEISTNVEQINKDIDDLNENVNKIVKYENNGKPTLIFSLPSQ